MAEGFSAVPTGWRLESYGANAVVLWYTPSVCATGQIVFSANAPTIEHNRLYATVLAAKASGAKVFVNYNVSGGVCTIVSFGID